MKVKGFGAAKVKRFGEEIISMIVDYCNEFDITPDRSEYIESEMPVKRERKPRNKNFSEPKKEKIDTLSLIHI